MVPVIESRQNNRTDISARLEKLYQKYNPNLVQYVSALIGNFVDAEDIVQDTFMAVMENSDRDEAQFGTLLYSEAQKRIISYQDNPDSHTSLDEIDESKRFVNQIPKVQDLTPNHRSDLAAELIKLAPHHRRVLDFYGSDMSPEEIAKELNLPKDTVRQYKCQALRKLRSALAQ